MPFWTLNKETNAPGIYGSITVMAEHTGISIHTLYDKFSRKKQNEFETTSYRIVKLPMIQQKKPKKKTTKPVQ